VPLSEARGVHKRAHLLDEGPARRQKASITRRNRSEQAQFHLDPIGFHLYSATPSDVPPAVRLHIFPIRPRLLVASLRTSHFGTSAYVSLSDGQRSAERDLGQARAAPTTRRTN
jgi:hypothetical protein